MNSARIPATKLARIIGPLARRKALCALTLATVALGALALHLAAAVERTPAALAVAARDDAVRALVFAQPFELQQAYHHNWRSERPLVDAGYLLVLDVDPRLVVPHQMAEPVLYAGAQTLERLNHGDESGRVIAILPATRGAQGELVPDLATVEFFFGEAQLPERVDAAAITLERAAALARGARPFTSAAVAAARASGGAVLQLADRSELDERAALLILEHSPQEFDLASGMLAPRVR